MKSNVDAGARLVNVAAAAGDQPYGQFPQPALIQLGKVPSFEPITAIEPDFSPAVREDIGNQGVCDQASKFPELAQGVTVRAETYPGFAFCTPKFRQLSRWAGDEPLLSRNELVLVW
jgi:hypothetical protein